MSLKQTCLDMLSFKQLRRYIRIKKLRQIAALKWQQLAKQGCIKLEFGSGHKLGANGWTTVDLYGADINYDLRRGIPLPNGSVSAIYSSHMLEHIPYQQLLAFLQECRRVLAPDGYFSVCVPNARQYIEAYLAGEYFRDPKTFYQPARVDTGSFIDQVNYVAYMGGEHTYLFDEENLLNTFYKAGYSKVTLREFDANIDIPERHLGSIYANALP
jgi:predicted SAM-dependent methyltransferase